jgi:hypothetical protein
MFLGDGAVYGILSRLRAQIYSIPWPDEEPLVASPAIAWEGPGVAQPPELFKAAPPSVFPLSCQPSLAIPPKGQRPLVFTLSGVL